MCQASQPRKYKYLPFSRPFLLSELTTIRRLQASNSLYQQIHRSRFSQPTRRPRSYLDTTTMCIYIFTRHTCGHRQDLKSGFEVCATKKGLLHGNHCQQSAITATIIEEPVGEPCDNCVWLAKRLKAEVEGRWAVVMCTLQSANWVLDMSLDLCLITVRPY